LLQKSNTTKGNLPTEVNYTNSRNTKTGTTIRKRPESIQTSKNYGDSNELNTEYVFNSTKCGSFSYLQTTQASKSGLQFKENSHANLNESRLEGFQKQQSYENSQECDSKYDDTDDNDDNNHDHNDGYDKNDISSENEPDESEILSNTILKTLHPHLTRICTWNIQTLRHKTDFLRSFVTENSIHILGVTETNDKGKTDIDSKFQNHHWFGRQRSQIPRSGAGGVGFLIHDSVLLNKTATFIKGTNVNSIFLHLHSQSESVRDTLIALVYGKTSPTAAVAELQWSAYLEDLNKLKERFNKPFDYIFMGDINARMGRPVDEDEKLHLGKFGETFRNSNGKRALKFLIESNLICLNDRNKEDSPHYTFDKQGQDGVKSIIDVICVSQSMYRRSYKATVLPITITGCEDHFPVYCDVRLHRKKSMKQTRRASPKLIWNLKKLNTDKALKFKMDQDTAISEMIDKFKNQNENCNDVDNPLDIQNMVSEITAAVQLSAITNIGKTHIQNFRHKSRLETKYEDLRKRINKLRRDNYLLLFSPETHLAKTVKDLEEQLKMMSNKIQKDKNKTLSQKVNRALENKNTRKLFSTVKSFNEDFQSKQAAIKALHNKSGELVTSIDGIFETLHDYWDSLFQRDDPINYIELQESLKNTLENLPSYRKTPSERDYFFTMFPNGEDLDELADDRELNPGERNYSPLCDEPVLFERPQPH